MHTYFANLVPIILNTVTAKLHRSQIAKHYPVGCSESNTLNRQTNWHYPLSSGEGRNETRYVRALSLLSAVVDVQ